MWFQVLDDQLDEPMELQVMNNGKVLFTERKGAVKLYDPETRSVRTLAQLDVHTNSEDGLYGMALDPGFDSNHWIYLYYAPAGEKAINQLSRFTMADDSLIFIFRKKDAGSGCTTRRMLSHWRFYSV